MAEDEKLDRDIGPVLIEFVQQQFPSVTPPVSVAGVPEDETGFEAIENWTAGLLRKYIEAFATAGQLSVEDLLKGCVKSAGENYADEREAAARNKNRSKSLKLLYERESSRHLLLDPEALEKVTRYARHLERSVYKNLREIQRIKALRLKATTTPSQIPDMDEDG